MVAVEAGPDVHVRQWRPVDSPALAEISNWAAANTTAHFRCGQESPAQWVQRARANPSLYPCFVAECDESVVGFALATAFHGGCGFRGVAEVSVYVRAENAGRGVGTLLYRRLIPTLADQRYRQLIASITVGNAASERLHARYGFSPVGVLASVGWKFDRWHDVALWQRRLREGDDGPGTIRTVDDGLEAASVTDGA